MIFFFSQTVCFGKLKPNYHNDHTSVGDLRIGETDIKCNLFTLVEFLKGNPKKCLDWRGKVTKSGAASSRLSKCRYFDQHSLLHDKAPNKPTESNLVIACGEGSNTSSLPSASSCESEVQPSAGVHKRKFSTDLISGGISPHCGFYACNNTTRYETWRLSSSSFGWRWRFIMLQESHTCFTRTTFKEKTID